MESHGIFKILPDKLEFYKSKTNNGSKIPTILKQEVKNADGYFHTHNLHTSNQNHYYDYKERHIQNNIVKIIPPSTTDIITQSKMYNTNKQLVSYIVTTRGVFGINPIKTKPTKTQLDKIYYNVILGLNGQVNSITPRVVNIIKNYCKQFPRYKRLREYIKEMAKLGVYIEYASWKELKDGKSPCFDLKQFTKNV